MQSVKFELLQWRARVGCAAFALVFCLASMSFVVVSFASTSVGPHPSSAKQKPEPACALLVEQRPLKHAPG